VNTAENIFNIYLENMPTHGMQTSEMSGESAQMLYDGNKVLVTMTLKTGEVRNLTLQHIVSGALIAGIVDQATTKAIYREMEGGPKGLNLCDIEMSIDQMYRDNLDVDHEYALSDLCEDNWHNVANIQKNRLAPVG
jgi:hypothetical protein